MIIVDGKLVSSAVFLDRFHCAVDKCKGACCIKGDVGAPLDKEEIETLESLYPLISHRIPQEGLSAIRKNGPAQWYSDFKERGTTLRKDGACAFVRIDENGIANCTIEEAWAAGEIPFRKPISCHLYPIRVEKDRQMDLEKLVYERWDICSPACQKGKKQNIKVYEFAREAIVRKYGEPFYNALVAADPEPEKTNDAPFE